MTDKLTMDVSMIKESLKWQPDKKDLKLYLEKMRECLRQLKELETEWEAMDKPTPDQARLLRFRNFWRVHKDIDIIYKWLRNVKYSNYALTSQDDVLGYIEYWEDYLKNE